ncbi:PREDICTED: balbiani ring protein 3-like [Nicrophorus vespilloides]|uniref:Balbiani ring protein 3-like n=1 Tax=Nicrophorus vespilloides TaxID=110193 RepID=A0ABM1NIR6_NICVS|nr:PREDICTED: balbiani ring protein 3-like [Nicrophorus vespilloides]
MIVRWSAVAVLGTFLFLLVSATSAKKEKSTTEAKCPKISECPYNAQFCEDDEDCNPDSACCNSSCGNVCTKQLFTGCQTLRTAAARRAKSLGVDGKKNVRIPRCARDGAFEPIQCSNEIVSSCWCVDEAGFEMPGTRAPAAALVNCTAPKPCAAHTCRMFCPHGFALAKDGCPLCKCRDPCEDVKCPDALACQLEELSCKDPPCPPIPTCKRGRSLDNICPVGDPLRISDTVRPFLCGNDPTKPNCPPMYQCLVQPGNDYGVCCPASLQIQKTGSCPAKTEQVYECGSMCTHDLECPSVQKCCETAQCGSSCTHPSNVTECLHQRALSEILAVSERAGRGYVPQCGSDGHFETRQCSRNGLVCWCVDRMGKKLKGSMGAAENVNCTLVEARIQTQGRSIAGKRNKCEHLECAAICEYGFKLDDDGCHTCKCDDPCEGYACPEDEECVNVKDSSCMDFLCPSLPVCRPKQVYTNPCISGTPLTDDLSGAPIACALRSDDGTLCPSSHECTAVAGSTQAVCCQKESEEVKPELDQIAEENRPQTMCDYLHSFSENMEGTRDGMAMALPQPKCDSEGNFVAEQCDGDCWCVDHFGTEIPKTRNAGKNCTEIWETSDCLDLTCRLGCDYGFVLDEETGCPTCQCRDPCNGISCNEDQQCQLVEVSCKDHYCPPVPACLPKKMGQCPYLVAASTSCDFECNSDMACNGTMRCCSNGCGTQCIEPMLLTGCQHKKQVLEHQARESGIPAGRVYLPQCKEDGEYETKQCDHKECWCVDFRGFEVSKTRKSRNEALSCEQLEEASTCPTYKCKEDCEHGFEMDEHNCRTCRCADPCSKISCREDGEMCRLVNVECVSWPCPAVPMCLPKKENPCQNGEPLNQISCGPDQDGCPSSHKCQLSPIGEYAVCCPKPRDVCFEALETGNCSGEESKNLTRYRFNPRTNKCENFMYSGCQGNHNNFHSEEVCGQVCPVLSQCERLREKNQRSAERYHKPTFLPKCDPETGNWENVQCLDHVGVCWCVNPQGEPLKGTLTRGAQPECNFRQARNRARDRSDLGSDADLVLEELLMQLGNLQATDDDEEDEAEVGISWELPLKSRCEALGKQCDREGKFLPAQCEQDVCWCVDEAGNQLPNTNTFKHGEHLCLPTPVESVEITLGFRGEYDEVTAVPVINQISKITKNMKGTVTNDGLEYEVTPDVLYIKFSLIGSNKVDVAYRLEQMVMQQSLPGMTADITRSRFTHRLGNLEQPLVAERVVALEHREIVSQSPVSLVAHYHTALIVIAAASAFVISVLTLLVILYKRKMANLNNATAKIVEDNQRFLSLNRPIYIELPHDKLPDPATKQEVKAT